MFYYCRDAAYSRPAPATLGSGRIAMASSADGIRWHRIAGSGPSGAVLDADEHGGFDSGHVGLTDVTVGPDGLTMWTFGGERDVVVASGLPHLGDVPGLAMRCGRAISSDGVTWRRVAGSGPRGALFDMLTDELYAAWPNALPEQDGGTLLHYTAPDRDMRAFRTRIVRIAPDGAVERLGALAWLDGPAAHDAGGIVTRHAIPDPFGRARWLMAYTALDADHRRTIALARSDDGLRWWHEGAPVLRAGEPGHWDDCGVAANRIVATPDAIHLYYYGFRSLTAPDMPRGIGLAIAPHNEPLQFGRIAPLEPQDDPR